MIRQRADIEEAMRQVRHLCDACDPAAALRFAEQLEGDAFGVEQVRALAEIDAGTQLSDLAVVVRGTKRLAHLEEKRQSPHFSYNRANGLLSVWTIATRRLGTAQALIQHRRDLHEARDIYDRLGRAGELDADLRCQALTNLGNSQDNCGRHVDALHSYDRALGVRPDFAMALGNRGMTLMRRAALDEVHRPALASEALAALDAALTRPGEILVRGGPSALESFKRERARISGTPTHHHEPGALDDAHLAWCLAHGLFLHASHPCIGPSTKTLDSLPIGAMVVGIDDASQQRLATLYDALNSLTQDYVAARYLTWMSLEPASPTRRHGAELSGRILFRDSLTYARWGVATGLTVASLAAATNLLDKIAGVAHQYLGTKRDPKHTYFRAFWLQPRKKNKPEQADPVIAADLDAGNRGLLALCDLAGELERPSELNDLLGRRHAATHRTVAVHDMLLDGIDDSGWLDRIGADDLRAALLSQLERARAALLYLVDLINDHERLNKPEGPVAPLPTWPALPERSEDW